MHADLPHRLRELVVVGEDRPAVAVASKRLAREEAGAPYERKIAAPAALVRGPEALRGVLDHRNAEFRSDRVYLVHVRRLTVEGDRYHCPRASRERRSQLRRIEVARSLFNIDE